MIDYAGIDYYTATTDSKAIGEAWFVRWNTFKESSLRDGNKVWSGKRYGYNCVHIKGLSWGARDKGGWMMTSSGQVAGLTWSHVLPSSRRVTRVDLHYTFVSEVSIDLSAVYVEWAAQQDNKRLGTNIRDTRGGQILYIGSRTSDQYGRFYDKTAEAGLDVENVYRLEVELKTPRADVVLEKLYDDFNRCSIRPRTIRDYVLSWFHRRGIITGVDFNLVRPIQLSKSVTTDQTKFIWLKTAVAPSLADLVQRGKSKEVARALGLKSEEFQQLALFAAQTEFDSIDVRLAMEKLKDEMGG